MDKNSLIGMILIIVIAIWSQYNTGTFYEREMEIHRLETKIQVDSLKRVINERDMQLDSIKRRELNWENIDYWMEEFGVQHKEVVMQQVYLETGNLQSDICTNNNNLFGMKLPRVRKTTAVGSSRGHAQYDDFVLSILDYALWQQNMYKGQEDYYKFLRSVGYAECETYIQKLKYIERNMVLT